MSTHDMYSWINKTHVYLDALLTWEAVVSTQFAHAYLVTIFRINPCHAE